MSMYEDATDRAARRWWDSLSTAQKQRLGGAQTHLYLFISDIRQLYIKTKLAR